MQTKSDVLHLPLIFPNSPEFRTLQVVTQDEAPILLGRVVSVAIAVALQRKVVFSLAELDAIASWRPRPQTFAEALDRVGWARLTPSSGQVEVTLPSTIQTLNSKRLAGKARASGAPRDATGKYLPSATASPRKPTRPRVTVDAEGKVQP